MAGVAFDATVLDLIICLCGSSDGSSSAFLGSNYGLQKVSVYFFECDDWDRSSHTFNICLLSTVDFWKYC
ncbi:Uncharacterised protein [Streptococcus pneumoniae]|nr:Uncharacterised protein [Streptococcus pneumoniae]CIW11179.1 Uncharacterised protein [Streptococcus pneumoniae]